MPCTVVNVGLAAVGSTMLWVVSPAAGVVGFVVALTTIGLRGYLVPGTPTLTQRYLPSRVMRWFGKQPRAATEATAVGVDTEEFLREVGILDECDTGGELVLDAAFRDAWRDRVLAVRDEPLAPAIAVALDSSQDAVSVDAEGESIVAYAADAILGPWSSRAAAVADIAAWQVLAARGTTLESVSVDEVSPVLEGLRAFVERCPTCDGTVSLEQAEVESCCASFHVARAECEDCGTQLLESHLEQATPS